MQKPTPETDSMVEESFHRINFPTSPVAAEFARKLEIERDEARELLAKSLVRGDLALEETKKSRAALLWYDIQDKREMQRERDEARGEQCSIQCAFEESQDKIEELERERDEAREDRKNSRQSLAFAIEQLDEARAVAGELAAIASHCLGSHGLALNDTAIKIAAALKRWKKMKEETK
jgi:hypothetical protein